LIYHNTFVKNSTPSIVMTPASMRNFISRNNLYVGAPGKYACQMDLGTIVDSDWDYYGFAGGKGGEWTFFLRWVSRNDYTLEQVRESGPAEKHAIVINHPEKLFADGTVIPADLNVEQKVQDLRLSRDSEAIDRGVILPGINDGYKGKAPDLGAYEFGQPLPHYGPRPE